MLQVVLLYVLGQIVHLKNSKTQYEPEMLMKEKLWHIIDNSPNKFCTCTELVIVLRANTVAQSLMVDWLSNAP